MRRTRDVPMYSIFFWVPWDFSRRESMFPRKAGGVMTRASMKGSWMWSMRVGSGILEGLSTMSVSPLWRTTR